MFGGVGVPELILIFMVILLLFGAKRLPEIGSSLGKGIREFKGSLREIEGELKVPQDQPAARIGQPQGGQAPASQSRETPRAADAAEAAESVDREPRRLFPE